MAERQGNPSWSAVPFGVVSLLMFGLSHREGRRAKELEEVHSVSSVSEALGLAKLLPILIAIRGKTGSVKPLQTQITSSPAVMIEDTLEKKEELRSVLGERVYKNIILRHHRNESDWFITDDGTSRLTVESCANASHLEKTLVTSKQFFYRENGTKKTSKKRMIDDPSLGVWQTEKSLPMDTTVTIVGELANSRKKDGTMVIQKPSNDTREAPFYITTQTFDELQRFFMRTSGIYKWLGVGFGAVSLILTGINLWKHVRNRIRDRNNRKRIADEKKWNEQMKNEVKRLMDMVQGQTHLGKCIVCFDNTVDAVFMPCGHLCACIACGEKLERCPICRNVCTVHKVYTT